MAESGRNVSMFNRPLAVIFSSLPAQPPCRRVDQQILALLVWTAVICGTESAPMQSGMSVSIRLIGRRFFLFNQNDFIRLKLIFSFDAIHTSMLPGPFSVMPAVNALARW